MGQELKKPLTSDQVRAARALLRWSAEDLSRRSSVSLRTIRRAELAERHTTMTIANNLAVRRALEDRRRRIHRRERRRARRPSSQASAGKTIQIKKRQRTADRGLGRPNDGLCLDPDADPISLRGSRDPLSGRCGRFDSLHGKHEAKTSL